MKKRKGICLLAQGYWSLKLVVLKKQFFSFFSDPTASPTNVLGGTVH